MKSLFFALVLALGVGHVQAQEILIPMDTRQTDHLKIMALAEAAVLFAREILREGGAFLCKVLRGGTEGALLAELKRDFATVKHVKPAASRANSAELYLLATGFRRAPS